jgi:polyhydroxyalkanoate synthesis regulator phasin
LSEQLNHFKNLKAMEKLENAIKKFVYTGVGFISLSAERFKKSIEELVENNKLSEEEGKKLLDEFFKEADTKKDEFESKLKKVMKKAGEKMTFVKAEEVEKLSKRLRELEKLVAEMKKDEK